jgi:hypothetical protein
MELISRMAASTGLVVFASVGAAGLYVSRNLPPACDGQQALKRVDEVLRDEYHLNSIFVNNIQTSPRGFSSDRRECSAEVVPIGGNVNATDMPWREV